MNLMIVESPNKVKKIRAILGPGWDVAPSVGHIRDLPQRGWVPTVPDYTLQYTYTERGENVVKELIQRARRADAVYLATDPDREGEAIAWHLKETLGLKHYHRITFDAITQDVIRAALQAPRTLDMALVHSQEARRAADRLVGYRVSPILSRQTGIAGLSAGRVQTVAVRLVVERQREIEKFEPITHFGAVAEFEAGKWSAIWDTTPFLAKDQKYILDKAVAEEAAQSKRFRVIASETKPARQAPPAPFTTATLLQAASVKLGFKPDQTAQLAQQLFAQGLITYHRTDSQNFSVEAIEEIRSYAQNERLPLPPSPRRWRTKDGAQEAHEAIRPTHCDVRGAGEDTAQQRLYSLIWERALASQLADAEYSVNKLTLESQETSRPFLFDATGRTLTAPGWRTLTAQDATDESQDDDDEANNGNVPALATGTTIEASSMRVLDRRTKPPKAYTQAGLIKKLESEGIGRPSTYAEILRKILKYEYVVEGKKVLSATDLGCLLIDSLTGKFRFVEYDYTRALEQELDNIASGSQQYRAVVSSLDAKLDDELAQLHIVPQPRMATHRPVGGTPAAAVTKILCPKCRQGHLRIPNGQDFYGCDQYQNGCRFYIRIVRAKKKLTEKQIETLCTKGKTGMIKGFINDQGNPFTAYLVCDQSTGWKAEMRFD